MTAFEANPLPISQGRLVKMEDLKRPSPYDHNDSGPPSKKPATSSNGAGKSNHDVDMPWKDDLEVCTCALNLSSFLPCGQGDTTISHHLNSC